MIERRKTDTPLSLCVYYGLYHMSGRLGSLRKCPPTTSSFVLFPRARCTVRSSLSSFAAALSVGLLGRSRSLSVALCDPLSVYTRYLCGRVCVFLLPLPVVSQTVSINQAVLVAFSRACDLSLAFPRSLRPSLSASHVHTCTEASRTSSAINRTRKSSESRAGYCRDKSTRLLQIKLP